MLALKETLRSLDEHPDPAVVAGFGRQVAGMKLWLQTNKMAVTSEQQRDLLDRIGTALDRYAMKTTAMLEGYMRNGARGKERPLADRVEQETSQVLSLARQLRVAERMALKQFVGDSRRAMTGLYIHVLFAIGLALLLGVAPCSA